MRDYSLRYEDARGRSGPSDFMKFADDAGATEFARSCLAGNAVVEVWKGSLLVVRLEQPQPKIDRQAPKVNPPVDAGAAVSADDPNILPLHGYARPIR